MKPRGREPLKDRIKRNASAFEALRPPGVPVAPIYGSALDPEPVRQARNLAVRNAKVAAVPYESTVQAEIIAYLRTREDIGAITRLNSGQAVAHAADGSTRYIQFNRTAKGMRVCDLQCVLRPSGKLVVIEVKRAGFREPKSPREREQANYLSHVRTCGGLGFFATSVADVERGLLSI